MDSPITISFPASLTSTITRIRPLLEPPAAHARTEPFVVSCDGETIAIPYRIYHLPPSESTFRALHTSEQSVAACWFSRHHDGYVRERFLRCMTAYDRPWIVAYVVPLCGEYIIEILRHIWDNRDLFDRPVLGRWLRDNPQFYARTRSRIVSYWDCYYRSSYLRLDDYIGSRLLTFFDDCLTNIQDPSAT